MFGKADVTDKQTLAGVFEATRDRLICFEPVIMPQSVVLLHADRWDETAEYRITVEVSTELEEISSGVVSK